jgi:aromatic-amino-acid transaminase
MEALSEGAPGDVVLLQAACHNPTGVDFTACQWEQLSHLIVQRELIPLVDAAYLGLGEGLDEDARGIRTIARTTPLSLVAFSCSKSFGLYRERTGALFACVNDTGLRSALISNALSIARANYSMPPDHGAAVVRLILEDPELARDWSTELGQMRARIRRLRIAVAAESHAGAIDLTSLGAQKGMFSQLPVPPAAMTALRREKGIYLAVGGRMNVAGLNEDDTGRLAEALAAVCPA